MTFAAIKNPEIKISQVEKTKVPTHPPSCERSQALARYGTFLLSGPCFLNHQTMFFYELFFDG